MQQEKTHVLETGILSGVNPITGIVSMLLVIAFVAFTVIDPEYAGTVYGAAQAFIASKMAWYYIGLMSVFLFISIYLIFSRYGSIKLGADDEEPEFNYFAWFSMLFGAGIGIGILFWSIAEPIYHFQGNPFISDEEKLTWQAGLVGVRLSIFHWGLHGWGLFVVVGLSLAYFAYRKGMPLSIRSCLYPIFGDRVHGPIGHTADVLAVFGTLFGIATSLGLGAQQMNAGLNYLLGIDINIATQMTLIAVVSVLATFSVVSGVNRGIKILSELNMQFTFLILVLFLVLGQTAYLLGSFLTSLGDYIINAIPMGFWTDPDPEGQWQGWWTVFYWGWWLSWGPFVGLFVARISRGRTIREFAIGVLVAPTLLAAFWICIFGNTAIFIELFGAGGIVEAVNQDVTLALFKTLELMDLGTVLTTILAAICTFMLVTYFVTSADSATLVICILLAVGNPHPPTKHRIFWGLGVGAVAAVLLLAGGLKALQTASIVGALPLSVVMVLMTIGLFKALREERDQEPSLLAKRSAAPSE